MFFLKTTKSLDLLEGGRLRRVNHNLQYYYDKMEKYYDLVKKAFTPYRKALKEISSEVKAFGGYGRMHGCIVDIDFYNHIYLDPFKGTINPYFALDTNSRKCYSTVASLLKNSPITPTLSSGRSMYEKYQEIVRANNVPLLESKENNSLAVPEIVLDKEMYKPSYVMRKIQYIFDQNVIRIWNDEVFKYDKEGKLDRS